MSILLYTFAARSNTSFKIVQTVEHPAIIKQYIYGLSGLQRLLSHIEQNTYDYILGFGDFRRNSTRIRAEKMFINAYGKQSIEADAPKYYDSTWLTNGPCNRSVYTIAHFLKKNGLKTKLGFIHIPRGYEKTEALTFISSWIDEMLQFSG
jgi:pyrrolidone-carboxylate peptidase